MACWNKVTRRASNFSPKFRQFFVTEISVGNRNFQLNFPTENFLSLDYICGNFFALKYFKWQVLCALYKSLQILCIQILCGKICGLILFVTDFMCLIQGRTGGTAQACAPPWKIPSRKKLSDFLSELICILVSDPSFCSPLKMSFPEFFFSF